MKKLLIGFTQKMSQKGCADPMASVDHIQRETDELCRDIDGLKKQIRVESHKYRQSECEWMAEDQRFDAIGRQLDDKRKQRDTLTDGNRQMAKHVEALAQTREDLSQICVASEKELNRMAEDMAYRSTQTETLLEDYRRQYDEKEKAYEVLAHYEDQLWPSNGSTGDPESAADKTREFRAIQQEIQALEHRWAEVKAQRTESVPSSGSSIDPSLQWLSDPIVVIVEIARLKVEANAMDAWIVRELMRREELEFASPDSSQYSQRSSREPEVGEQPMSEDVGAGGDEPHVDHPLEQLADLRILSQPTELNPMIPQTTVAQMIPQTPKAPQTSTPIGDTSARLSRLSLEQRLALLSPQTAPGVDPRGQQRLATLSAQTTPGVDPRGQQRLDILSPQTGPGVESKGQQRLDILSPLMDLEVDPRMQTRAIETARMSETPAPMESGTGFAGLLSLTSSPERPLFSLFGGPTSPPDSTEGAGSLFAHMFGRKDDTEAHEVESGSGFVFNLFANQSDDDDDNESTSDVFKTLFQ